MGIVDFVKSNKCLFKAASVCVDCLMDFKLKTADKLVWGISVRMPLKRKKILFSNFDGRGFADNPKYIAKEMYERKSGYELYWILQNPRAQGQELPDYLKPVKAGSFAHIYHMATSKFWVNNVRIASYFKKRKNQIYIQTWHAGLGFKKIEKDVEDTLSAEYIAMAKRDSRAIDLIVSNGSFMTGHFKRIFWYNGEFLEKGHPRNDILCLNKQEDKERIRKQLGIEGGKKLALYAPTFRASYGLDVYDLDYERVLDCLQKKFGGEWVMLIRLHPNLFDKFNQLNIKSNRILNVSAYSDMQELLLVSDAMFTDFSSAMFEFAIMDKPCFLYASDLYEYLDERGLLITLDEVPFPQSDHNDKLAELIEQYEREAYLDRVHAFMEGKSCDNGQASKAVADWITEHTA